MKKKNTVYDWAENEVKLACKRENPDWNGKSFDYGCSCYKNALDAFKAAMKQMNKAGHSGFSYAMTRNILKRLLDEKPLLPIVDADFVLDDTQYFADQFDEYSCSRYSGLYKRVYKDGKIEYRDVNRIIGIDQHGCSFTGGMPFVSDFIPEISMPYSLTDQPYRVYVWQFTLTDDEKIEIERGICNAEFVRYVITPDNEKIKVNRLYIDTDNGDVEKPVTPAFIKRLARAIAKDEKMFEQEVTE